MRRWLGVCLLLIALAVSSAWATDRASTPASIEDVQKRVVEFFRKDWRSPDAEADDSDSSIIGVHLRGDHYFSHRFDISELFPRVRFSQPKQADIEIAAYVKETWLDPSSIKYASDPNVQILPATVVDEWRRRFGSETDDAFPVFDRMTNDLVVSYQNRAGSSYLWGPIRNGDLLKVSREELVHRASQNLEDLAKLLVIRRSHDGLYIVGQKPEHRLQSPDETILNDAENLILSKIFAQKATRAFPGGYYLAMPEPSRVFIADARQPDGKAKLREKIRQLIQDAEARFTESTTKPTCEEVNRRRDEMQPKLEEFLRKNGGLVGPNPLKRLSEEECDKQWEDGSRWRPTTFEYPRLSENIYEMRNGKLTVSY